MLSSAAFNAFYRWKKPMKRYIFILATAESIKIIRRYCRVVKYLILKLP
jgi:DNA polymerase III gamma/tau subunit